MARDDANQFTRSVVRTRLCGMPPHTPGSITFCAACTESASLLTRFDSVALSSLGRHTSEGAGCTESVRLLRRFDSVALSSFGRHTSEHEAECGGIFVRPLFTVRKAIYPVTGSLLAAKCGEVAAR